MRAVDITVELPSVTWPGAKGISGGDLASHVLPTKFPVVYLPYGYANDHARRIGYTNVELYAEERRIAIVNTSVENKAYVKVFADDFRRFVSEELPEFVCNYYPISARPDESYIAGLSMGGYGTFQHGLAHSDATASSVPSPTASTTRPLSLARDPLGEPAKQGPDVDLHNLAKRVSADGKAALRIYASCGMDDFLFETNKAFAAELA